MSIRFFSYTKMFFLLGCFSCTSKPEPNRENELDEALIEKITDSKIKRSQILNERAEFLENSYLFVSLVHLDTAYTLKAVRKKFSPVLNVTEEYNKTLDNDLIPTFRKEYSLIVNYCKLYSRISILNDSVEDYFDFFRDGSKNSVKKLLATNIYNDLMTQKILIMEFKYDSLIFEGHKSILEHRDEPFSNDFIEVVPQEETHQNASEELKTY